MSVYGDRRTLEEQREERRKAAKKRRRKKLAEDVLVGVLGALGLAAIIAVVLALGAVIFLVAWNLGVVNIAAAAGASVSTIGFWAALGGSLAVGIISRIFRREPVVKAEANKS